MRLLRLLGLLLVLVSLRSADALVGASERPLADVLLELRARGLRIVFSSELVRTELRSPGPAAGLAPQDALAAVLEPHGLAAVAGPGGTWLVVRAPASQKEVAPPPPPPPPPVFPVGVDLVTVDAVVLGERGRPLAGMAADEFKVFEDGEPQTLVRFDSIVAPAAAAVEAGAAVAPRPRTSSGGAEAPAGRVFVIVFDEVHLSTERAERAKGVLEGFLRTQLREGDRVTILPTGGGAWWNGEMNAARRDLEAFLRHLKGLRAVDGSSCALNEYDAMLFHRQRDPGIEARLVRWANECNPTLDPPVIPEARTDDQGRALAPSLREARERRAELHIAPGRGQIQALAANIYDRANQRRKRTLDALARLLDGLAPLRGRKAVLLVSEGFVLEPGLPEARRVAAASARANAPVYFIDARTATGLDPLHSAEAGNVLESRDQGGFLDAQSHLADGALSVALETGGRAERGDLAAALARVAQESTAYYLLGYHPSNPSREPRFRKIRIETTRAGVSVLARPGYYPASGATDAAAGDALDPRVRGGLDLGAAPAGVPTRLAAFVLGPATEGKTRALLLAEADPRALGLRESAGSGLQGTLDTFALVVSRETGAAQPLMQRLEVDVRVPEPTARDTGWLAVPREFELLPGTYQARFVVRGPGGRVGVVEHAFVVPPSGLRIATPVLSDLAPQADGRLALSARTLLRPTGSLFCQFQVYGATRDPESGGPRVVARYAVRHADGRPLVASDTLVPLEPGSDGAPARLFEIPLAGAESGAYRLTLEVRDQVSGQFRERQDAFELEVGPPARP